MVEEVQMHLSGRRAVPGRGLGKEVKAAEEKAASLQESSAKEEKVGEKEARANAPTALQMGNPFVMHTMTSRRGAVTHAVISSTSVDFALVNIHYTPANRGIVLRLRETGVCLFSD